MKEENIWTMLFDFAVNSALSFLKMLQPERTLCIYYTALPPDIRLLYGAIGKHPGFTNTAIMYVRNGDFCVLLVRLKSLFIKSIFYVHNYCLAVIIKLATCESSIFYFINVLPLTIIMRKS